ncbi:hypothetical protein B0I35DRAFT_513536 [Stachybotrys elegans]|uniref:Uncharacterized protein n=1 Tax=Stachybotrys elegans TaxID=80388 RepID=A0A8K0SPG8_9HYPO|nr:hypothetical protein B0I35DRAFT_513536 [Stachybotrys elegans]
MSYRPPLATVLIGLGICIIVAVIPILVTVTTISSPHWDNAYPSWEKFIKDIIRNNCTESVTNYRDNRISHPNLGYDAMGCILEAFPEYRKAEIAAASVPIKTLR